VERFWVFRGVVQRLGLRFTLSPAKRGEGSANLRGLVVETEVWFCYMVRCADGSFYVGIANDVEERIKRHNWGVGPGYTAKRRPVTLIWTERHGSSEAARRREKEIKGWNRTKKFELARRWQGVNPSPALRAQGKGESSNG
jgi:putative endonuclease